MKPKSSYISAAPAAATAAEAEAASPACLWIVARFLTAKIADNNYTFKT